MDGRTVAELIADAKKERERLFNTNPEDFYGLDKACGKYSQLQHVRNLPDTPEVRRGKETRANKLEELGNRRWKETVGEHVVTYQCMACGYEFNLKNGYGDFAEMEREYDEAVKKREKLIHDEICRSGAFLNQSVYL